MKPYYSLDAYCKNQFHHKCYKIALNAHMTCPNRDGTLGTRGCIFCSAGGSGDFAISTHGKSVSEQLSEGLSLFRNKFDITQITQPCLIGYFQSYTNTYAPLSYLRSIFTETLSNPLICGISIATRPDCMPDDVLSLLSELQERFPDKFIWIELGLQTIWEDTAQYIRRGYELSCFEDTFWKLKSLNIPIIVHTILGLPGEDTKRVLSTIHYLNTIKPFGIKLQLLHVLKDTDLAYDYSNGLFEVLSQESYIELVATCVSHLSPEIVIHRITGDGPKDLLIAPKWSANKKNVLNSLHHFMKERNIYQGKLYVPTQNRLD